MFIAFIEIKLYNKINCFNFVLDSPEGHLRRDFDLGHSVQFVDASRDLAVRGHRRSELVLRQSVC